MDNDKRPYTEEEVLEKLNKMAAEIESSKKNIEDFIICMKPMYKNKNGRPTHKINAYVQKDTIISILPFHEEHIDLTNSNECIFYTSKDQFYIFSGTEKELINTIRMDKCYCEWEILYSLRHP